MSNYLHNYRRAVIFILDNVPKNCAAYSTYVRAVRIVEKIDIEIVLQKSKLLLRKKGINSGETEASNN